MDTFVTQVFVRVKVADGKWESLDLINSRVTGEQAERIVQGWTDIKSLQTLVLLLAGMCRIYLNGGKS